MARVSTDIKRLFVRVLADSVAKAESASLYDALLALAKSQYQVISSGEIAISRSGDGFSGSFSIPNPALSCGVTPVEIAALCSELLDRYDRSKRLLTICAKYGLTECQIERGEWNSSLPVVNESPDIQDADIANDVLHKLVAVTTAQSDYFWLRLPPWGQIV